MRSAIFAGAIVATALAAGCASTPSATLRPPSPTVQATPLATPATNPTPTPTTCPAITTSDAAVMLTDWVDSPTYTVNLVNTDGCIVASATAHTWPGYAPPDATTETVTMPTSESATRVYFLDGDSTVRYLALDGSSGVAAELPGSVTGRVSFSVSPDNSRIAFSVMSWGSTGFQEQSYVEDLGTGANRTELFTISDGPPGLGGGGVAEEPIGWVNGDIVYGLLEALNQYSPGPFPPPFEAYHIAKPSNGQRLASICAGSGNSWVFGSGIYTALPAATGVLCRVGDQKDQPLGTLVLVSWSGIHLRTIGEAACATPAAVSPGGNVAIAGQVNLGTPPGQVVKCSSGPFTIKVSTNGTSRTLAATGLVEGWMDDTRLVVDASTNRSEFPFIPSGAPFPRLEIVNVGSGVTAIVAVKGLFAGSVPSGI
jgi:hypothetical protein